MLSYLALLPFGVLAGIHIYSCAAEEHKLYRRTKPFLMPMLAVFALVAGPVDWLIIAALLFGCLGDTLLLYGPGINPIGCAAFLVGHLFYIASAIGRMTVYPLALPIILGLVLYCGVLLGVALVVKRAAIAANKAGVVYFAVICLMSLSMFVLMCQTGSFGAVCAFVGSIIFIVSDTLLVYSNFTKELPRERLMVMSTYLLAQFGVAIGLLTA